MGGVRVVHGGQPDGSGGCKDVCSRAQRRGAGCPKVRDGRMGCCWALWWMAWLTLVVADWLPGLGGWDAQGRHREGSPRS
jgi:hypothetical protein